MSTRERTEGEIDCLRRCTQLDVDYGAAVLVSKGKRGLNGAQALRVYVLGGCGSTERKEGQEQ